MRRSALCSPPRHVAAQPLVLLALGLSAVACGTNNSYYETKNYLYPERDEDAGTSDPGPRPEPADAGVPEQPNDAGSDTPDPVDAAPDAGPKPLTPGAPLVDTSAAALPLDVFGVPGAHYWFVVADAQLERMNERYGGGGGFPIFGNQFGDIYTPGGTSADLTFADHVLVTVPGALPQTADFGKVQVSLVGESTGRPWTEQSLPNLKLDADEFVEGNRLGGVKHMRLNNAIVGSIFREKLTLDLYAKLGYPAPRANYAWVSSSVWGPDVSVPYIVVESYKPQFCKLREAQLGGGCVNMWEFAGDLGNGSLALPDNCQFSECDSTRAEEFELVVGARQPGPGYKAALADWLDWDSFHRFQCLSWILATGDDVLHNSNNLVMVERADGKFQHLPYSVDISLGQDWYPSVSLGGQSVLAQGCQSDPQCWTDTITTCEGVLADFVAAGPVTMLESINAELDAQGMLRDGDDGRYRALHKYLERRLTELPVELEANRAGPVYNSGCSYPLVQCGDYCDYPENCYLCQPGPDPGQVPGGGDAGAGVPPVVAEPRGADGERANAADVALPGGPGIPLPPGPEVPPPVVCVPPIEVYGPPIVID